MNSYTQATKLHLKTKLGVSGKSVIEEMFFTPPLKIIDPIYEGDVANIMLLSVSAGLMKGDCQDIDIFIGKNSKIKLTSQSFEKVHNTQDGKALRRTIIHVENDAMLDFFPLPVIPFAQSNFENTTQIFLGTKSTLYYSEIFCAGRVSRNEVFDFTRFDSKLHIFIDKKIKLYDNMLLEPKDVELQNMCMFDNYTHYLSLVIKNDMIDFEEFREMVLQEEGNIGVSKHDCFILLRALGRGSEELLKLREKVILEYQKRIKIK
ncbi:urease accessory protein UreD [Helicobacter anatolicus]|uniref:urease accessory protein UreD n=1 Tax=Helicobacter anatolicus TaxID=2905874 RepID=UPI001E589DFD|nr:urease accessory protein UreD [Helicobacter anatolicus]MCE3039714.1 urease accessory protein UreD [Helicobacter anatolicus]